MSKVSDKLSANIRTVKAGQEPAGAEQQAKTTSKKPAAKPVRNAALEGRSVYQMGGRGTAAVEEMEAIIEEVIGA